MMITVTALLSGCGVFNRVHKERSKENILEKSKTTTKKENQVNVVDRSVTTITEKTDTTIETPKIYGQSKSKIDLDAVKDGLTVIDDQFLTLSQVYDTKDSTLKTNYVLKPQKVPVPKEKKTEIRNDINTSKSDRNDTKREEKKQIKKADVIIDRKPDYKVVFIIVGIIALVLFVRWLINRRKII